MWPAHWLLSQYLCWPVGGIFQFEIFTSYNNKCNSFEITNKPSAEIDIMESISKPISQMYH
jgi:hypothetical protein